MDNFPPGLLNRTLLLFWLSLWHFIINLSLETGVVRPNDWKVAKVIPLYKSGSLAEIDNILQTRLNSPYFFKDLGENSLQAANGSSRAS